MLFLFMKRLAISLYKGIKTINIMFLFLVFIGYNIFKINFSRLNMV